jgi:hypothetical protein
VKIWLRLRSGELIAKNGFCVVAPMRMMRPSSTSGSSTSCWERLKRCNSSTNRIVRRPVSASSVRASSRIARTSLMPVATALTWRKTQRVCPAMTWASAVLPVPGGP